MPFPFVVSGDVQLLLEPWAKANGFKLPGDRYFHQMRKELYRYLSWTFPNVEYLNGRMLRRGVQRLVSKVSVPIISLDHAYCQTSFSLEMSRHVSANTKDIGIRARHGSPSLLKQLNLLPKQDVALVDDVIYSGELMERVINILSRRGTHVRYVFAAVGVGAGTERIRSMGVRVACVKEYDQVIDEVCERDFYPGIPFSGRSLVNAGNMGIPYILPWGKPSEWASIQTKRPYAEGSDEIDISAACIRDAINLYQRIERLSGKEITLNRLDRRFPVADWVKGRKVTRILEQMIPASESRW